MCTSKVFERFIGLIKAYPNVRIYDMKKYSPEEFRKLIAEKILSGELEPDTDNSGQLMFYTGLYENVQGEVQDEEDPLFIEPESLAVLLADDEPKSKKLPCGCTTHQFGCLSRPYDPSEGR